LPLQQSQPANYPGNSDLDYFLLDISKHAYIIRIEYTKNIMKKDKMKVFIGVIVGGMAGYLLYRFVGCKTGTCIITSKPWSSILYGMLLGLLIGLKW